MSGSEDAGYADTTELEGSTPSERLRYQLPRLAAAGAVIAIPSLALLYLMALYLPLSDTAVWYLYTASVVVAVVIVSRSGWPNLTHPKDRGDSSE